MAWRPKRAVPSRCEWAHLALVAPNADQGGGRGSPTGPRPPPLQNPLLRRDVASAASDGAVPALVGTAHELVVVHLDDGQATRQAPDIDGLVHVAELFD